MNNFEPGADKSVRQGAPITSAELLRPLATTEFVHTRGDDLVPIPHPVFIFGPDRDLSGVAELLSREDRVYIDTETAFFDAETGRKGDLALIQLTLPKADCSIVIATIVDFDISAKTTVQRDLTQLKEPLERQSLTLVAHSAWFEKDVLGQRGIDLANLSDTQKRGAYCRPDITSKALIALCQYIPGEPVRLDKTQQASSWLPPLSDEQLAYAVRDTVALKKLDEALLAMERATEIPAGASAEEVFRLRKESVERLNALHDLHPEYFLWEAEKKAISEELTARHPAGGSVIQLQEGKIVPGRPRAEIDAEMLTEQLLERCENSQQGALLQRLSQVISRTATKGAAVDLLKPHRGTFGIERVKDVESFVNESMKEGRTQSYRVVQVAEERGLPACPVAKESTDDELMSRLSACEKKRLRFLQVEQPEIPLLRLQIRECDRYLQEQAKTAGAGIATEYGVVEAKQPKRQLDPDDLLDRLKKKLVCGDNRGVLDQLETIVDSKVNYEELKALLRDPAFCHLGLHGSTERRQFLAGISLPTGSFSQSKASPKIV